MSGPLKVAQVWFRRSELAAARASSVVVCRLAFVDTVDAAERQESVQLVLRLAHPLYPSFQAAGLWLLPAVLLVGGPWRDVASADAAPQ